MAKKESVLRTALALNITREEGKAALSHVMTLETSQYMLCTRLTCEAKRISSSNRNTRA
jgi:hypothetical protein